MQVNSHQPPTPAWWPGFTFFSLQTWSGLRNPRAIFGVIWQLSVENGGKNWQWMRFKVFFTMSKLSKKGLVGAEQVNNSFWGAINCFFLACSISSKQRAFINVSLGAWTPASFLSNGLHRSWFLLSPLVLFIWPGVSVIVAIALSQLDGASDQNSVENSAAEHSTAQLNQVSTF